MVCALNAQLTTPTPRAPAPSPGPPRAQTRPSPTRPFQSPSHSPISSSCPAPPWPDTCRRPTEKPASLPSTRNARHTCCPFRRQIRGRAAVSFSPAAAIRRNPRPRDRPTVAASHPAARPPRPRSRTSIRFTASAMISALCDIRSTASTTPSSFPSNNRSAEAGVKNSATVVTRHAGLINRTRSANTAIFGRPICPSSAGNCRFTFVTHTSSRSINVIAPTPLRARPSTVHEPTPPTPITATCAARSRASAAVPNKRPTPPNRSA